MRWFRLLVGSVALAVARRNLSNMLIGQEVSWTTTSWIFMAVAYASQDGPVELDEIIGTADGINKAIPSYKELQRSLGQLQSKGVVEKKDGRYALTDAGASLMDEASAKHSRMFDVLDALSGDLPDRGDIDLDEEVTLERVNASYERYKKRFWRRYRELEKGD